MPAPIAFFAFNRPEHTKKTLDALAKNCLADKTDIFIFCDGPRSQEEAHAVDLVRKVCRAFKGCASVTIVESPENKGLACSIISGVNYVFEYCDALIVLEDDIVVSSQFLSYMNDALDCFKHDADVGAISGFNFSDSAVENSSFFLWQSTSWGWATWADRWKIFQPDASYLLTEIERKGLQARFDADGSYPFCDMLNSVRLGLLDSWAIRWYASLLVAEKLTLFPDSSLVCNIGFDGSGVHCSGQENVGINEDECLCFARFNNVVFPKKAEINPIREQKYHANLQKISTSPPSPYSYAQNFEDVYLAKAFKGINNGFYIDAGAAWPVFNSVTWQLYLKGWTGIDIEPTPVLSDELRNFRTRNIVLQVVISDKSGSLTLFESESISSSTVSQHLAKELALTTGDLKSYNVPAMTLTEICDAHCPQREIHFLKIDVEGFERKALQGLDFSRYRPWLVIVEATANEHRQLDISLLIDTPIWEDWEKILLANGYDFAFFDGINRWYVADEHPELHRAFIHPVRLIDNIQTPEQAHARWMLAGAQREIEIFQDRIAKLQTANVLLQSENQLKPGLSGASLRYRFLDACRAVLHFLGKFGANSARKVNFPKGKEVLIGIDCLQLKPGVSGGVESYMEMLVGAISRKDKFFPVLLCGSEQYSLYKERFQDKVAYYILCSPLLLRCMAWIIRICFNKEINLSVYAKNSFANLERDVGVSLLHSPVQIFSYTDFSIPGVLNLHDLQHLHLSENFSPEDILARNKLYALAAKKADKVIASSQFVADDIVVHDFAPRDKVVVIPVTWNPEILEGDKLFDDVRKHYRLPARYIFYPAQFWAHKNHWRLVEALSLVRQQPSGKDLHLVFTGNRSFSGWSKTAEVIDHHSLNEVVHCLDRVPTKHLAGLYKAALFCVMPSTFEASSYPVIEAQLLGCPVMCSNVTSLPELVADGAGRLFDPWSSQDIADAILTWLRNPNEAAVAAGRAYVRVREQHSQEAYADAIEQLYETVLSQQRAAQ